ncbi:Trp family transcriptional regulator [Patescibacteria group bacterium]
MPQVSRFDPKEEVSERIVDVFLDSVLKLKTRQEAEDFFSSLFTPTEQVMLVKRLAIAVLLAKGYDYGSIKGVLKVSQGTVSSVKEMMARSRSGFKKAIQRVLVKQKVKNFLLAVDQVLEVAPPFNKDWSAWRKRKWQRNLEKTKPF